jgi:diguanylate cyclase
MGGEEFSVFLPGLDPARSEGVAERIRVSVNSVDFQPDGRKWTLSISVGGTTFSEEAKFLDLFRQADALLFQVKRTGRNRVEIAGYRGMATLVAG